MLRVTRREEAEEACCAYCRGALDDGAALVDCTRCGVTEHAECSREAPRCPTIGCPGRSWRPRPTDASPLAPLRSRLCRTCGEIIDRSALQCGTCRPTLPPPGAPVEASRGAELPRSYVGRPLVGAEPWPRPHGPTYEARARQRRRVADVLDLAVTTFVGIAAVVLVFGGLVGLILAGAYPDVVSAWIRAATSGLLGGARPLVLLVVVVALLTAGGLVASHRQRPR